MKIYNRIISSAVILLVALCFVSFCVHVNYNGGKSLLKLDHKVLSDSTEMPFQGIIDSSYDLVFNNSVFINQEDRLKDSINIYKDLKVKLLNEIESNDSVTISKIFSLGINNRSKAGEVLNDGFNTRSKLEIESSDITKNIKTNSDSLGNVVKKVEKQKFKIDSVMKRIKNSADSLSGPYHFRFKNINCRIFVAKRDINDVQIHSNSKGPFTFSEFEKYLFEKKRDTPLMTTNGGMFSPEYKPQGLLIDNFKIIKNLDLSTNRPGNFYLLPNGVFYIDSLNNFHVENTNLFQSEFLTKNRVPKYATQSGPMLVVDGKFNKHFTVRSPNINIRSGVGEISKDKIVFIISDDEINFNDFSLIFKYYFDCKNALYLDGAISKMCFNTTDNNKPAGNFGPMISVNKKK